MTEHRNTLRAILWGVGAAFFLSSTFIINSLISGSGGHWAWTANLRTLFLIPILALVLIFNRQLNPLIQAIRQAPLLFLKWGIIGFGFLYTALALASLWSPGWIIAATFQINILAGILLAPYIYTDQRKVIPGKALSLSVLIVIGVFVMQLDRLSEIQSPSNMLISFLLVMVGAIVWPLGNRKLMVELEGRNLKLNAMQRVLGMSIGCFPLLLILAVIGFEQSGLPAWSQCEASFYSALFSGFVGGVGFYQASQMVHKNPVALASIEATQVFEIVFTLIGEILLLGTPLPGIIGQAGLAIVFLGIAIHVRYSLRHAKIWSKSLVS